MTRTNYRWFIVFLLFAITAVNYIDRAAISYAIPMMQRDLGLSPADTGIILGAFGLGYAITTLIGGFAVDRYGARLVLAVAAIGLNFPALTDAVSHWLSPHERATALGNALFAVPLALAIGGPICTQLLGWLDWHLTFAALFILSIVWVPLWYFLFRDDPAESRFVNAPSSPTSGAAILRPPHLMPARNPGPSAACSGCC
jgi:ACS family hexuronate transporter-like MFS transporter